MNLSLLGAECCCIPIHFLERCYCMHFYYLETVWFFWAYNLAKLSALYSLLLRQEHPLNTSSVMKLSHLTGKNRHYFWPGVGAEYCLLKSFRVALSLTLGSFFTGKWWLVLQLILRGSPSTDLLSNFSVKFFPLWYSALHNLASSFFPDCRQHVNSRSPLGSTYFSQGLFLSTCTPDI